MKGFVLVTRPLITADSCSFNTNLVDVDFCMVLHAQNRVFVELQLAGVVIGLMFQESSSVSW